MLQYFICMCVMICVTATGQLMPADESSTEAAETPASDYSAATMYQAQSIAEVERGIRQYINAERRSLGLGELSPDDRLSTASMIRSQELYANGYFDHTRPNGAGWETVLQNDVPVDYTVAGENLASIEHNLAGNDPAFDPYYWYKTWRDSPVHYENIVKSEFTHIGVAIYYTKKDGMTYAYATTLFAAY